MTPEELDAIEAAARAPMSFDRPKINCTHDEERGHAPWCFACEQADRASRPVPFERRGRFDVLALVAEVRRLTAERDEVFTRGVEAMREAAAKACNDRAAELDEGVSDDEAETDEEGYGRFQEALALEAMIRALKVSP